MWLRDGAISLLEGIGGCNAVYLMDQEGQNERFIVGCAPVGQKDVPLPIDIFNERLPFYPLAYTVDRASQISIAYADWSANDEYLAYTPDTGKAVDGIYLMTVTSGTTTVLSKTGLEPVWSPDSKYIAFISGALYEDNQICVININTGSKKCTPRLEGKHGVPTWSPDSKWLVFVLSAKCTQQIYVMNIDSFREVR